MLTVEGPTLTLRYATADDAPRLFELGEDPEVTRWFSWGPYSAVAEPQAYIASLEPKRRDGSLLEFVVDHRRDGVIGITGLSEVAARDRRATVGTWFGRPWWGTGANMESKALVAALAFEHLGFRRLTAWANVRNGRSQMALERVGFRREGVLRSYTFERGRSVDNLMMSMLRGELT
jgi:ribosomal-protein-alanine N-acetyltransferase